MTQLSCCAVVPNRLGRLSVGVAILETREFNYNWINEIRPDINAEHPTTVVNTVLDRLALHCHDNM